MAVIHTDLTNLRIVMGHAIRTNKEATPTEIIRATARQHGIVGKRTATDDLADNIANLAGDSAVYDEIEDLVVTIQRKGVITAGRATSLYGDYLALA
jgi:hypothetical protein